VIDLDHTTILRMAVRVDDHPSAGSEDRLAGGAPEKSNPFVKGVEAGERIHPPFRRTEEYATPRIGDFRGVISAWALCSAMADSRNRNCRNGPRGGQ